MDLPGHTDEVYCVDFVADKIASGGRDKKVKMYVDNVSNLKRFVSLTVRFLRRSTAGDIRRCSLDITRFPVLTRSLATIAFAFAASLVGISTRREKSALLKRY